LCVIIPEKDTRQQATKVNGQHFINSVEQKIKKEKFFIKIVYFALPANLFD